MIVDGWLLSPESHSADVAMRREVSFVVRDDAGAEVPLAGAALTLALAGADALPVDTTSARVGRGSATYQGLGVYRLTGTLADGRALDASWSAP